MISTAEAQYDVMRARAELQRMVDEVIRVHPEHATPIAFARLQRLVVTLAGVSDDIWQRVADLLERNEELQQRVTQLEEFL